MSKAYKQCMLCKKKTDFENIRFFGKVFLANNQFYKGYCIVASPKHTVHLHEYPEWNELINDAIRVGRALTVAYHPKRINYEILGNSMEHLHVHVIPRHVNDPHPTRPIWDSKDIFVKKLTENEQKEVIHTIKKYL